MSWQDLALFCRARVRSWLLHVDCRERYPGEVVFLVSHERWFAARDVYWCREVAMVLGGGCLPDGEGVPS